MCQFYNHSDRIVYVWFFGLSWDPGKNKNRKHQARFEDRQKVGVGESTVKGLGGRNGIIVVSIDDYYMKHGKEHFSSKRTHLAQIGDNHGWCTVEKDPGTGLYVVRVKDQNGHETSMDYFLEEDKNDIDTTEVTTTFDLGRCVQMEKVRDTHDGNYERYRWPDRGCDF
jgi:hypothetical protein